MERFEVPRVEVRVRGFRSTKGKSPESSRLVKEEREERSAKSGSSGPLRGSEAETWLHISSQTASPVKMARVLDF